MSKSDTTRRALLLAPAALMLAASSTAAAEPQPVAEPLPPEWRLFAKQVSVYHPDGVAAALNAYEHGADLANFMGLAMPGRCPFALYFRTADGYDVFHPEWAWRATYIDRPEGPALPIGLPARA